VARQPFDPAWEVHNLGFLNVRCPHCGALHWLVERLVNSSLLNPKFGMCCVQGKISLPPIQPPPLELFQLLTSQEDPGKKFCKHIRNYNNALAMTSVGCKLDDSFNRGGGPYSFRLHGELIHRVGSLLPPDPQAAVFSQLYIHDNAQQAHDRRASHPWNSNLHPATLRELQDMLWRSHPGVRLYKQAFELTRAMPDEQQCRIALHFDSGCDRRRYQAPDAAVREIAVILPGDGDQVRGSQDIILYRLDAQPLQHISDSHPFYPALRYVLLFPTGQLSWHPNILFQTVEEGAPRGGNKRTHVSMAEFHCFCLFIRHPDVESDHIFRTGDLYQEYVCETWAVSEQNRLNWFRHNQDKLRKELYKGLVDAVAANADADWDQLGQRFILPSSFSGSTRHMQQLCQDALAINRYYGGGDLFITMTANPAWPEIQAALFPGQTAPDRPDLVVRAFKAKLDSLIKEINGGVLGAINAFLYTIEFQKRGLPHAHIIVFLKAEAKLRSPENIDSLMSSEFPEDNPELLELIKKFMVHGPCGDQNRNAPCMVNGKCSKGFPKQFREETSITEDSYACTRRRDNGRTVEVGRRQADNRWVVCHSIYLIWRYRCHINVESIASVKAIKYIYKYVYKGHDRTTMEFGTCRDEIKQYLDARYVSSCEALWRTYQFEMQEHYPTIVRLQVHLPDEQTVIVDPATAGSIQDVVDRHADKDTTLTGWFKANAESPAHHHLLYQDFPNEMVWNRDDCKWTSRQTDWFAIGRMYHAHPTCGERFYLRLLLTCVKAATSFEDLYTFDEICHPSFKAACIARGLLDDDGEWHQCLNEAKDMQMGQQLRHLFVTILRECTPANPRELWDRFWEDICDDLRGCLQRQGFTEPTDAQHQDYGLFLIDKLLSHHGKRLQDWETMPLIEGNWGQVFGNRLMLEQQDYFTPELAGQAAERIATFTPDQSTAFEKITSAVSTRSGEIFFLHGPGGTGKTYLYNTLCDYLRCQNNYVLCVASSGIAAILLKGGRTAHSRFKIPIPCHESSVCSISKTSELAELICSTSLVIWDEAPMQHRHIMEAVERTFQDVCSCCDKAFGGVSFVFGGDFQQIEPVIIGASRGQTVGACLQRSNLWRSISVLQLHQNKWLDTSIAAEQEFAKWQLEVGQGLHTDSEGNILIPDHMKCRVNSVDCLIDTIYPGIRSPNLGQAYFSQRTVLSSLNVDVDALNKLVLERFPGCVHVYHSADFIPDSEQSGGEDAMLNYPVEYLNEINCSGLPLAKLELKIGCPVMILRNLDAAHGVCNGSRGILTQCKNRVLEVQLLNGEHAGTKVFIPRIANQPTEDEVAFKFTRKQFPA
jgi:hypothetical protein